MKMEKIIIAVILAVGIMCVLLVRGAAMYNREEGAENNKS